MLKMYLIEVYNRAWMTVDHRVNGWLFMSSIKPVICIVLIATFAVFYGPIFMKNRRPLNVAVAMVLFNIFIVFFNLYISVQFLIGALRRNYNWVCELPDYHAINYEEIRVVKTAHLFFLSKLLELCDSLFIIARKKPHEMTKSLALHHSVMVIVAWAVARWTPSGSAVCLAMVNAFSHAIMYAYYGFIMFLPQVNRNRYWKGFVIFLINFQLVLSLIYLTIQVWTQCPVFLNVAYVLLVLVLFMLSFHIVKYVLALRSNGNYVATNKPKYIFDKTTILNGEILFK